MIFNCTNCTKEFSKTKSQAARSKSGNHFCSRSCAVSFNNKITPKRQPEGICAHCKAVCKASRKYCNSCRENYYKSFKEMTLEELIQRASVKGKHQSWKNSVVGNFNRSWNKSMTQLPCANCGYDKHVELCHIKPISDFPLSTKLSEINHPSNVIQLCPNCHWEFDNSVH